LCCRTSRALQCSPEEACYAVIHVLERDGESSRQGVAYMVVWWRLRIWQQRRPRAARFFSLGPRPPAVTSRYVERDQEGSESRRATENQRELAGTERGGRHERHRQLPSSQVRRRGEPPVQIHIYVHRDAAATCARGAGEQRKSRGALLKVQSARSGRMRKEKSGYAHKTRSQNGMRHANRPAHSVVAFRGRGVRGGWRNAATLCRCAAGRR